MNILVTGSTGFIGSALCRTLHKAGHVVTALSRDPSAAQRRVPQLQQAWLWDHAGCPVPAEALRSVDGVVHLAGESVAGRWTNKKKQAIRDSRVVGTGNLVAAIRASQAKPAVLVCASAVGYYGDRGEQVLTEDSDMGSGFLAEVCRDWEQAASGAEQLSVRVVRVRFGVVLGPGGGALAAMLPPFKLGLGGPLGCGRQWWPWVHLDDVVGIIIHALQQPAMTGPVNATAPNPVRQWQFARILGRLLHRPAFLLTPAFALKLVVGQFANELLASSHVLPERAQQAGYKFNFPQLEPALQSILQLPAQGD